MSDNVKYEDFDFEDLRHQKLILILSKLNNFYTDELKEAFHNIMLEFSRDEYKKQQESEQRYKKMKNKVLKLQENLFEDKLTEEDKTLMIYITLKHAKK